MRYLKLSMLLACLAVLSALLFGCESRNQGVLITPNYSAIDAVNLQAAAEKGDKDAQFALAVRYQVGEGVNKDLKLAVFWYSKATEAGHLGAMNNLAALYYDGKGVSQDFGKAIELYKRIADAGDVGGTASLAGMYLDGKGVPQDYSEARRLYMLAAKRGYGPAQNAIGMMYKFGWGGVQDNVEAYAWWILAAENGDTVAAENMRQLEPSLMPVAIEQARQRSKSIKGVSID